MSNHQVNLNDVKVHIPQQDNGSNSRNNRGSAVAYTPRRSGSSDSERYWESPCCGKRERFQVNCVKFLTQYLMIIGLLCFFGVGLYQADTCEGSNLYQSLMLLIIGVALPSPSMK